MEVTEIILSLLGAGSAGAIIMKLIDKFFLSKKEKTEVKADVIGNGARVADLYKQIEEIVAPQLAPLKEDNTSLKLKVETLTTQLSDTRVEVAELKAKACFRKCAIRMEEPDDDGMEITYKDAGRLAEEKNLATIGS